MSINLHHPAGRLIQRRLQRLLRPTLRVRIDALRTRLAPGRITPVERVMLRSAIHVNRSFTAHVSLQALLSAGAMRHTHRVETLQLREGAAAVPALRQLERVLVTQRVLHERLVQRLTASTPHAAPPRTALVTRVEQRHVFPRVQLTLVRAQPAVPSAAGVAPDPSAVPGSGLRAAVAQPRGTTPLPPLVLPPQELSRLTDHVIRQLDHRVLSYQERTGRV